MDKKLITTVSIVFALVFIAALSMVFMYISKSSNDALIAIDKQQTNMRELDLSQYDNTTVSGAMVKNAIETINMHNDIKMGIGVYNINSTNGVPKWYIYGWNVVYASGAQLIAGYTGDASTYGAKLNPSPTYVGAKPESREYISDNAKYSSRLVKAGTGTVVGIEFKYIKE